MSGKWTDTLPQIDSVWIERDRRFERYVRVVGYAGFAGSEPHKMVFIQTVSASDGRAVNGRTTKARLSAFGKRYVLVSRPALSLARGEQ